MKEVKKICSCECVECVNSNCEKCSCKSCTCDGCDCTKSFEPGYDEVELEGNLD
jgi:hypothetical protein